MLKILTIMNLERIEQKYTEKEMCVVLLSAMLMQGLEL